MAVTRAEVAALAGVSPAVVSYVINGGPRPVAAQTRLRVQAAIDELGYRPNRIAAALRGGMTRSIGLLTPSPGNPFFAEVAEALVRELFDRGNTLSIGITDDDLPRERLYLRSFLDRQVDGIILTSAQAVRTLEQVQMPRVPVLVIDRVGKDDAPMFSRVHVDNEHGAQLATEHLQGHGHRVIGCVAGPWPVPLSDERVRGWRQQQEAVGEDPRPTLVEHAEFSEIGGYAAASALLGPDSRREASGVPMPSALFVASDVQAIGVILACRELGLRVPEDIAIVSFDGTAAGRYSNPPLTSVRQPVVDMARLAVGALLERIHDPSLEPMHEALKGNLVVGESCGCSAPVADRHTASCADSGSPAQSTR